MANKPLRLSYIVPAYNAEKTVRETIASIIAGNVERGDEIIVIDDASTDNTRKIVQKLHQSIPMLKLITHEMRRGGGEARNTGVMHAKNPLIFSLDADNVLVPNSVSLLRHALQAAHADAACFQELWFFHRNCERITHKWQFPPEDAVFADYLIGNVLPGASGNYLYTKESWYRASGYPQVKTLDTWGFGLRQVGSGQKMIVVPGTHYLHRWGHNSNWIREHAKGKNSLIATELLLPFIDQLSEADCTYIFSKEHRRTWFESINERPLTGRPGLPAGHKGQIIPPPLVSTEKPVTIITSLKRKLGL